MNIKVDKQFFSYYNFFNQSLKLNSPILPSLKYAGSIVLSSQTGLLVAVKQATYHTYPDGHPGY